MRATGEQPGEQMMDTSNEPTGPTIDENLVNQLVEMGYPYHASRKALYHSSQQLEVQRLKCPVLNADMSGNNT